MGTQGTGPRQTGVSHVAELRLLGPMAADVAGRPLDLGTIKQRIVLVALLVNAGSPITVETLIDRVWDESPPPQARSVLYAHLSRIRRMLAGVTDIELERHTDGYLIRLDPDRVDLHRLARLVERSRRAGGTDEQRAALLREAVGLCRGEPLAGLPGRWIDRVRQSLREQRLAVVLEWADLELRLANPAVLVGPLTAVAVEHPLVEPVVAMLMRALHRLGRGAEALDWYGRTRTHLAEELGVDPGAELRELHQALLRTPAAPAPPVVPGQLPLDVRGFSGRTAELAHLDAILVTSAHRRGTPVVAALSGTAGVGKTTLAVHWAHQLSDRFPDGHLYVNLRGFDPTGPAMSPAEAIRGFLSALDVPPRQVPAEPHAQVGLYRSVLAGKRMLIVLDNARDAEHVRPLLPGTAGCLVVVTSRTTLSGLVAAEGAHPLTLDLLTPAQARQLLAGRLGTDRTGAEPAAVDEIVARCAGLPLALAVVAARAVTQPRLPLAVLAEQMRQAASGLDAFDSTDLATDLRALFHWSYRALSPAAARLFRLLGLHPGPDIATAAAASLAGEPVADTAAALAELAGAHLVLDHGAGRYAFHDLLRAYAAELATAQEPEPDRQAARHRLLDHYLHSARQAALLVNPQRQPVAVDPPVAGVTVEDFTERDAALAWFTAEHPVLRTAVEHAAANGFDTHTSRLAWTLAVVFQRQGHWHDWAETQRIALGAAQRSGDVPAQARAHRSAGRANALLGAFDAAHVHYRSALDRYAELGDRDGLADTHHDLSEVLDLQRHHRDALDHARRALDIYRDSGNRARQARVLNSIGWCHAQLGDARQALVWCRQALELHQTLGNALGAAASWDSMGYAHHQLGAYADAAACFERALALARELNERYGEAATLHHLGDARHAEGDDEAARAAWLPALVILDELNHPEADEVRTKLRSYQSAGVR